jgi:hypothetical protein
MKGAVVFAVESGLGRQAKQFYDHGIFDVALIQKHSSYVEHPEWYKQRAKNYDELLEKCSEIWFFETPFDWSYIIKARNKSVKTVLVAMYECTQSPLPYFPDVILGGSVLETEFFNAKHINVPVPDEVKWKQRKKAEIFVHNAGHGGLHGRNGTQELVKAMEFVKSPIELLIRTQYDNVKTNDPRIKVQVGDLPYEELFSVGDVFIYPDKFGGSCLPLQEAFASGMMTMASNRHPSNLWLPTEPLIPIKGYEKKRIYREFDAAIVDPVDIAKNIDYWYGKDISKFSKQGKEWGKLNSWGNLKKQYEAS